MLSIPAYPRRAWTLRLGVVTAVLSVGLVLGYGIPVASRTVTVHTAENAAASTAEANQFWHMVAGDEPDDTSDLGRVATKVRDLGREPKPIQALLEYYVPPNELPDIGDRLGYHAFERPHPDVADETLTDQGHFTDRFILDAIQALGAAEGTSVRDVLQPVPDVPDYGYLRWQWGVVGMGGLLAVSGLCALVLRYDRRRWPVREKARALAALNDDQRSMYALIEGLQRQPRTEQRDDLIKQAQALFRDMGRGLDTRDKLDDFREALTDAGTAWAFKREAYNELPSPPRPGGGAPD